MGHCPDRPGGIVAVHHRHLHIHQDQPVLSRLGRGEGLCHRLPVLADIAGSPHHIQQLLQDFRVDLVVLRHQNVHPLQHAGLARGFRRLLAVEDRVHLLPEAGEEERLRQAGVHPGGLGLVLHLRPVVAGQNQDRHVLGGLLPDEPCGLHAIDARHLPIQDDGHVAAAVLLGLPDHFHGRPAVGCIVHGHPRAFHDHLDVLADHFLIVHRQETADAIILPELLVDHLVADMHFQVNSKL